MEYVVSRRLELVHRLKDRLGQGVGAATGVRDVVGAFVTGRPLRADQAVLAAAVRTDADVTTLPAAALGGASADALLRWDQF